MHSNNYFLSNALILEYAEKLYCNAIYYMYSL